jgi:hypothetical protein
LFMPRWRERGDFYPRFFRTLIKRPNKTAAGTRTGHAVAMAQSFQFVGVSEISRVKQYVATEPQR